MPRFAPYGWQRHQFNINVPAGDLASTSAIAVASALPLGFKYVIEKVTYVASVAHTGAGGSRTLNIKKGSTVVATGTLAVADLGTAGAYKALTVDPTKATFDDGDTLTIDFSSGGTVFTAGSGELIIQVREEPQRIA